VNVAPLNRNKALMRSVAPIVNFGGTAFGDIALVPAPFLKHPRGIRDIAEWYMSTASRQDYIHAVFARQCEIALENLKKIWDVVGNRIHVVFLCGTDFGTQTSQFCSTDTFASLYAPYYKKINDWIHAHTAWKTFKHCCGAVEPFMQPFIDAGFDVINPVQCSAAGMDPEHLKAAYGDELVFWGGGVDTQKTLPFGTPEEVYDQVRQRIDIFGENGGFVFNTIHNLQAKTPVENIASMVRAIQASYS
jgi:uroporphyrinogen-III decarboxylase